MPNIPVIPGTSRVQDVQIGVKEDASPQLKRLNAAKGLYRAEAGAVTDAAGAIGQYEEAKTKAEEVAAFNQASIITRKTTSAFRDSLRNNPDDQKWVQNWQDAAKGVRDQVLADPRMKGPARQQMIQTLDRWQGDTTAEFQTAADIAGSQRRKRTGMLAANEALTDGNEKAAHAAIDSMVKTGDMWPEEAAHIKTTFTSTIQENKIRTGMEANPVQTLKDIDAGKFGAVKSGPMVTLRREVQTAIAKQQNQGRDDILRRVDDGETVNEDELKMKEKVGTITPEAAKSIRTRMLQKDTAATKEKVGEIQADLDHFNPVEDKDGKEALDLGDRIAALPAPFAKRLSSQLQAKLKAPAEKEDYGAKYLGEMLSSGKLGTLDENGKPTDASHIAYFHIREKLDKFRQENPQATFDEERSFIVKNTMGERDKSANRSISVKNYLAEPNADTDNQ